MAADVGGDRSVDLDAPRAAFRDELLAAGLIFGSSSAGVYGRSGTFEAIALGVRDLVRRVAPAGAEPRSFPPVMPRTIFEKTDYLASFPQLIGAIDTFVGDDKDHARLLRIHEDHGDWSTGLTPSEVVMVPAACHPLYPTLTGAVPEGGSVFEVLGMCFRHEPSPDPMRMQSFRQFEYVYVGEPSPAEQHRDAWVQRGLEVLDRLGLQAEAVDANDPFFGRAGRVLAAGQVQERLKIELVVQMYGPDQTPSAVVSGNQHRDHFGEAFGIRTSDGDVAHSACIGFGLERITLAVLRHHGLDPAGWAPGLRTAVLP
jgi:seryl-tRNA synthetase